MLQKRCWYLSLFFLRRHCILNLKFNLKTIPMKVVYSLLLFLALCSSTPATAQLSILFVDDSSDTFGNAELFASAIDSVGYSSTYYNASDSASGPTADLMMEFDLVVWHTSTDGVGLKLWNGADEDNPELISYLDGGGRLWLVLDFLFDRYGVPGPTSFVAGNFAYDYLGITSYDVQSNGNDGGLGVPLITPDTNRAIPNLPEITWQFPALNWVDGVQLEPGAAPLYRMDGNNYPLAESICGVYNDNRTAKVITYFFDLALTEDFALLKDATAPVLAFFENIVTSAPFTNTLRHDFTMYPNPTSGNFSIDLELEDAALVEVNLLDYLGRVVAQPLPTQKLSAGRNRLGSLPLRGLPAGMYLVRLTVDGKTGVKPLVVQN